MNMDTHISIGLNLNYNFITLTIATAFCLHLPGRSSWWSSQVPVTVFANYKKTID